MAPPALLRKNRTTGGSSGAPVAQENRASGGLRAHFMVEIRIAETVDEKEAVFRFRYAIYVEEMGRYKNVADRVDRRLSDPEDDWSWISYALDGDEIVGTLRLTWGGAGFSDRQVRQYGLQPFLDELPHEVLAVGERAMGSPTWRGEDLLAEF